MSWTETVVSEYGRSLGLSAWEFNAAGVAGLRFERLGRLFIERLEVGVLVYLTREYRHPDAELFQAALALCHWDQNPEYPVNASLEGEGNLVFSVSLSDSELDLPALERAIDSLDQLHNAVLEGSNR
jgi:type III secretion system chaperone SycN